MNPLQSFVFATLMLLAAPAMAQVGPMQADSAPAVAAAPEVPEIAPAPAAKGDCKQCKEGGKMAHGDMGGMQHGMSCCKGMQAGAAKGGCDKCKQAGMGRMAQGEGKGCCGGMQRGGKSDMACCKGMQAGAAEGGCDKCKQGGMGSMAHVGDSAALEQRVDELEKRLAQVQEQLRAGGNSRN